MNDSKIDMQPSIELLDEGIDVLPNNCVDCIGVGVRVATCTFR